MVQVSMIQSFWYRSHKLLPQEGDQNKIVITLFIQGTNARRSFDHTLKHFCQPHF